MTPRERVAAAVEKLQDVVNALLASGAEVAEETAEGVEDGVEKAIQAVNDNPDEAPE